MQILGPDEGSLPTLPEAPILERWLFESPMLLVGLLGLVGLVLLFMALRQKKKAPPMIAGVVLLLAAAGVYLTAGQVTTDREVLVDRTAKLVGTVAESDTAGLRAILNEPFRVGPSDNASGFARSVPRITSFEFLENTMSTRLGSMIGSHQILETRAGIDRPGQGRTLVRVRVRGPQGNVLGHSWWEVEWRETGDEWLATRIEAIWIQG